MACCNNLTNKTPVKFFNKPRNISWFASDGQKVLFEECVFVKACNHLSVDAIITAEISGIQPQTPSSLVTAYNVYRLFVNNAQVAQSGYEAGTDQTAPNLSSASLMWAGSVSCSSSVIVRVTAELKVSGTATTPIPASNVTNALGSFKGAKGAYLRVTNL